MTEAELTILIAETLRVPASRVTRDADLLGDLGADSLGLAEVSAAVEGQTGLSLPIEELPDVTTVGDLFDLLAGLKNNTC